MHDFTNLNCKIWNFGILSFASLENIAMKIYEQNL
jgi:hypothetical protein